MNYFEQESERLTYRRLTTEGTPSWLEFFHNNDRLKYFGMDPSKSHEELAKDWIEAQLNRYKTQGFGHLAVIEKDSGDFIGMSGILPRELNEKEEYEISYSLKPNYWGKGYGTEMAKAMTAFGTKHINTERFISIIHIDNTASAHVAKKNGMDILFQTEFLGMKVNVYGKEV